MADVLPVGNTHVVNVFVALIEVIPSVGERGASVHGFFREIVCRRAVMILLVMNLVTEGRFSETWLPWWSRTAIVHSSRLLRNHQYYLVAVEVNKFCWNWLFNIKILLNIQIEVLKHQVLSCCCGDKQILNFVEIDYLILFNVIK